MTLFEYVFIFLFLCLFALVAFIGKSLQALWRQHSSLIDIQSRYWREHKDDYYKVSGDHRMLLDALGMVESPASQKRYIKKESK